ncbi:MAG: multidrug DMT transporter permease [Methylibium sp. NZG]|nr:MAG: multidrug DMT transporter permease [Methylibium sp. NZG]
MWVALALVLVWGANFSVQKAVFNAMSPGGFLFVRYLIMPVAAALLLFWRHGLHWPRLPREDLWALLRLGVVGHVLHVGLVTYGIHWSTPFSSALILACGPVFTLLILRWYGLEHLTRGQVAGVAVACLGVLVFLSDKLTGGQWRAGGGDLVLLIAAAFFSYYTVMAKPQIERHGSVTVMAYATLMASAPLVALNLPAGLGVELTAISPAIWMGTFYSVLISAFLGWMVWGWVNAVRGVARTAPLMYLMPPVAGLVAWALTGERYTAVKLAGAALTLAGVALAQFASASPRDPVREAPAPVD